MELSYENSRRILDRQGEINLLVDAFSDYVEETRKQENRDLNRQLYELAEKEGVTLWDICFSYMPERRLKPNSDMSHPIEYEVGLVLMPLELEKGPGYWKGKYYNLKRKIQAILDRKDDEDNSKER